MPGEYVSYPDDVYIEMVNYIKAHPEFKTKSDFINKAVVEMLVREGVKFTPEIIEYYRVNNKKK